EEKGEVMLWPDTFTNNFQPEIGKAAVEVLEAATWWVTIPTEPVCCGLAWISTGQLKTVRGVLGRTISQLADHAGRAHTFLAWSPAARRCHAATPPICWPIIPASTRCGIRASPSPNC